MTDWRSRSAVSGSISPPTSSTTLVAVTGGTGVLLLVGDGAAASLSGQAVDLRRQLDRRLVSLNTTGLGGRRADRRRASRSSPPAITSASRATVDSSDPIDLGPISLSGGFVFQAGDDSILITISNGSFAFGDQVTITGVNGSFEWDGADFAGSLSGLVHSALPGRSDQRHRRRRVRPARA